MIQTFKNINNIEIVCGINTEMKRDSQKIPKIRKQYVQTIYDGLVNQFDQTKNGQLSEQIDKILTLQSVYQESFRAQDSIIKFISALYKEHQSMVEVNFDDFKEEINELSIETDEERKKQIALSLNNRVEQVRKHIQALTVSLTHSDFLNKKIGQIKQQQEKNAQGTERSLSKSAIQEKDQIKLIIELENTIEEGLLKQRYGFDEQWKELNQFLQTKLREMNVKRIEQLNHIENSFKERVEKLIINQMEKKHQVNLKQQTRIFKNCLDSIGNNLNNGSTEGQFSSQCRKLALLQRITQREQDRQSNNSQLENMETQSRSSYNKCSKTEQQIKILNEKSKNDSDCQKKRSSNNFLIETEDNKDMQINQPQITSFRMCHSEQNEDSNSQMKEQQRLYEKISRQKRQQTLKACETKKLESSLLQSQIDKLFKSFPSDNYLVDMECRIAQFLHNSIEMELQKMKQSQEQLQEQQQQKNQKIDELVEKIYEIEQERIRKQKMYENIQKLLETKQKQTNSLHINLDKMKQENMQLISLYKENKNILGQYKNRLQDLQDQIKELNSQKDKFVSDKLQLQTALDYVTQAKEQMLQQIQELNEEISKRNQFITQLNTKIEQMEKENKQKKQQDRKNSFQTNANNNQLHHLQQKIIMLESAVKQKNQYVQKMECDLHMMKKSCEDIKYMNSILKKDISKIKTIQNKDWDKESKIIAPSKMLQQNSVLVEGNPYLHSKKQALKENKNLSFTEKSNNNFTPQRNPVVSIHLKKSSLNFQSDKINPSFSRVLQGPKEQSLNLDFQSFQQKNNKAIGKGYNIKNNKYESLTERPITQIVKKKYMF